jgi:hypothetical protein
MPTVKGRKSPSERFAGADDTYTIEALMQNGWALQSGTRVHGVLLITLQCILLCITVVLQYSTSLLCPIAIYTILFYTATCSLFSTILFSFISYPKIGFDPLLIFVGTAHFLGLNFAKAFDVYFQTETGD